ncbi:hypothetical protein [Oceanicoccus sp. KOV_DT_Chl]|uniref:hypothetical protein n=1 Tax=Oceanicoccus sp. KOV_DT_Chl TaxID=1904639 RepID=UPI00190E9DC5|nr:hypothetical protein [Oceanicoccus sp. KOV_DT_Chl]
MKLLFPLFFASILLFSTFAATENHQNTTFKVTEINKSLILLQGKGGNIALSRGTDGLLIIDDDYAEMSTALKQKIDQYGGVNTLKYIINTHWHGDHTAIMPTLAMVLILSLTTMFVRV